MGYRRRPRVVRESGRPPAPAYPPAESIEERDAALTFAAFLAGLQVASVPLIVLHMLSAKPALALVAEDCSGLIARLVQAGHSFTGRLCFFVRILAGRFRFHDSTRAAILLPAGIS